MGYEVKIVLDSMAPCGKRLTTLTATYPRFIHSEVLTHRDRARNSASSRAIPFPVMTAAIEVDPVIPLQWLLEQSGMQGGAEIPEALRPLAREIWLAALKDAQRHAKALHNIGVTANQLNHFYGNSTGYSESVWDYSAAYKGLTAHERLNEAVTVGDGLVHDMQIHKSIPNRLIEPFMWMTVLMTATEWKNFFRLRCHPDAEIHFQKIAGMMRDALEASIPLQLNAGEWHLPYVTLFDRSELVADGYKMPELKRISTGRCARVSYLTHEKKREPQKDLDLFTKLEKGSGFGHWSPPEHVAEACDFKYSGVGDRDRELVRSGPFIGWKQFRKEFALENSEG